MEIGKLLEKKLSRDAFVFGLERAIWLKLMSGKEPYKIKDDTYLMTRALLNSVKRAYEQGISPAYKKKLSELLLGKILFRGFKSKIPHKKTYGIEPPSFVTISPTNSCNLKCVGCYAASPCAEKHFEHLDYDVFCKIIEQNKTHFGSHFVVISGGEPLLYRGKNGKTLSDILQEHNDVFFLMYTNGTLINKEVAKKFAKLGNITPAISVEGFKEETDWRRGKGAYKKILQAMENLREAKVPFGISITPTSRNIETLFSKEFIDFWFEKQGALFAWSFQYLPQGRNPDMHLIPTPEQRFKSYFETWKFVRKGYMIADFWNCGTVTRGCMAAGKPRGGYFHILWNGDIELCVFAKIKDKNPTLNNVYNLFNSGKSIVDAIFADAFVAARQEQAYLRNKNASPLTPCLIRDHSALTYEQVVKKTGAIITDEGIEQLIKEEKLPKYGDACRKLLDAVWRKNYLRNKK